MVPNISKDLTDQGLGLGFRKSRVLGRVPKQIAISIKVGTNRLLRVCLEQSKGRRRRDSPNLQPYPFHFLRSQNSGLSLRNVFPFVAGGRGEAAFRFAITANVLSPARCCGIPAKMRVEKYFAAFFTFFLCHGTQSPKLKMKSNRDGGP